MPRIRRRIYLSPHRKRGLMLILIVSLLVAALTPVSLYLRQVSGEMALSDASDLVTMQITQTIEKMMAEGKFEYDYFVTLQKDASGRITAITSNMPRINTLSAEILNDVVNNTGNGELNINVPLGNLTGLNLLLGRGPDVPIKIIMLTSSRADFRNEIVSAGINQTKHQIMLEVVVDIDVLTPWKTLSTQVVSEILVAETVIVGSVPDTYLNLELDDGYTQGDSTAQEDDS